MKTESLWVILPTQVFAFTLALGVLIALGHGVARIGSAPKPAVSQVCIPVGHAARVDL